MAKTLGIADFAKKAGIEEPSARVMLRKLKVKKKGKTYEFKDMAEIESLLKKARPAKKEEKKSTKKKSKKSED